MARSDGDDRVVRELRDALVRAGLTAGVNLLVRVGDGVLQVHLIAVDLGRLGLLLATLSDPAELADPASLSVQPRRARQQ